MRFLMFAALAALFALPVGSAEAGVLGSALTFDGTPDFLADDSLGIFIDTDNDGIANVVQGIVNLTGTTLSNPGTINELTGGNLYAAYSFGIELDPVGSILNPGGPVSVLNFNGTGAPGAGFGVIDILDSLNVPVNDLATVVASSGDPLIALFTDNGGPSQNLSVFENASAPNGALDLDYSGSATELDLVLTAGFDGVDDFYSITNTVIGTLAAPSSFGGVFDGAFTVLNHEFIGGVFLDVEDESGAFGNIVISAEAGPGDGTFSSSNAQGFTFGDNASFVLNAVPEPTSSVTFAAIFVLGMTRRRKR